MAKNNAAKPKRSASRAKPAGPSVTAPPGLMAPPESGVKVRMYRQGHGDCFLLALRG